MSHKSAISDGLLHTLLAELDSPSTIGFLLTGSHARREATHYSDIDLLRFVAELPPDKRQQYTLKYHAHKLISISTSTVEAKKQELARPETAVWVVPGLRQAQLLIDKDGSLAKLRQEAIDFRWAPLQQAADEYASYQVMGNAEEVYKILGALDRRDESALVYGTFGLILDLTRAIVVQRGVLIRSENSFFRQAYEAAGEDSQWSRWHRVAAGFEQGRGHVSPAATRGIAALQVYIETVGLLREILQREDLEVIEKTIEAIERHPDVPFMP